MNAPATPTAQQIAELCRLFRARQMAKPLWTHQAHLAVATDILYELGAVHGDPLVRHLIRANNEHMGIPNSETRGYHETITTCFINAITRLIADPPCRDRDDAIARVLASPVSDKDYVFNFYTPDCLGSTRARFAYVPPDRAPLP